MIKTFNDVVKSSFEDIDDITKYRLLRDINNELEAGNEDWKDKLTKLVLSYSKTGSVYFKNVWGDKLKNEDAFKEEYVTKINKETEKYDLQLNTGNMVKNVLKGSSIHYESRYPIKPIPVNGGVALLADPETKGLSFIITDDENRAKWLTGEAGIKIKHSTNFTVNAGGISISVHLVIIEDEIRTLSKQEVEMVEDVIEAFEDRTIEPRGDVKKLLEKIYKFRDGCDCKIDLDYDEFWSIGKEPMPLRVSKYIDKVTKEKEAGNEGLDIFNRVFYNIDKAFEKSVKGVMNFFQTTNIFIDDMVEFRTKTPAVTTLYKLRPSFIKDMGKVKFYNVANKKAPVLLGFSLTYDELRAILESNKSYVKGLHTVFDKFDEFILGLIESNKDNIVTKVDMGEVRALSNDVVNINKSLDKVTNNKKLLDRRPLGSLTKNFNDLKTTIDTSLKLGLDYRMEMLEEIYERNEAISSDLEILYAAIKGKKISISKEEINKISEYIGSVAKMVTAVAFLFYLYYQLIDMLIAAIKIVEIDAEDHSAIDKIANTLKDGWDLLRNAFK